mmetsp:Transcript_6747/g.21762  ORF Transcript_6747/g.21762 Transcript_6747/m.21762 type:complete len:595 (-) Transcript_6747:203-1987(-)
MTSKSASIAPGAAIKACSLAPGSWASLLSIIAAFAARAGPWSAAKTDIRFWTLAQRASVAGLAGRFEKGRCAAPRAFLAAWARKSSAPNATPALRRAETARASRTAAPRHATTASTAPASRSVEKLKPASTHLFRKRSRTERLRAAETRTASRTSAAGAFAARRLPISRRASSAKICAATPPAAARSEAVAWTAKRSTTPAHATSSCASNSASRGSVGGSAASAHFPTHFPHFPTPRVAAWMRLTAAWRTPCDAPLAGVSLPAAKSRRTRVSACRVSASRPERTTLAAIATCSAARSSDVRLSSDTHGPPTDSTAAGCFFSARAISRSATASVASLVAATPRRATKRASLATAASADMASKRRNAPPLSASWTTMMRTSTATAAAVACGYFFATATHSNVAVSGAGGAAAAPTTFVVFPAGIVFTGAGTVAAGLPWSSSTCAAVKQSARRIRSALTIDASTNGPATARVGAGSAAVSRAPTAAQTAWRTCGVAATSATASSCALRIDNAAVVLRLNLCRSAVADVSDSCEPRDARESPDGDGGASWLAKSPSPSPRAGDLKDAFEEKENLRDAAPSRQASSGAETGQLCRRRVA